jgi:hypothetical protein
MAPSNTARPASGVSGRRASETDRLGGAINGKGSEAAFARQARNTLTDSLEVMADWKAELLQKHRRAMLIWELGLISYWEWQSLIDEAGQWREAAKALRERMGRAAR